MADPKKRLSPGKGVKRVPKKRGPGKPDAIIPNFGWMAKFDVDDAPDDVELVHFPAWAFWVDDDGSVVAGQPIIPVDPLGKKWGYGNEIDKYIGFEEPEDSTDVLDALSDDDDDEGDDDDDDEGDDDEGDDDEGDDDEGDDDDEPEVIDADGRPVGEAPPAGRASG